MRYKDADGYTFAVIEPAAPFGERTETCIGIGAPAKGTFWLTPKMARTLAADLIAFADQQQQETENEG